MTANYTGSFVVYNLPEMLKCFEDAMFIDCRINAYPELAKIDKNRMKFINIIDDIQSSCIYRNSTISNTKCVHV